MEIKLFGKSLFSASKKGDLLVEQAFENMTKDSGSKFLPDFYKDHNRNSIFQEWDVIQPFNGSGVIVGPKGSIKKGKKGVKDKKVKAADKPLNIEITPKGVYEMKMLHDTKFTMNTNPEYIEGQIGDFKDKLNLIKSEEYDMRRGVEEVSSMLVRMENRKKYGDMPESRAFFEEFPYTTTSKINELIGAQKHLKVGQVAQFLADMPKDAVKVMKDYNEATQKVCEKQAVFYIIANEKDFKKSDSRRDPILLAQSPFGHFWQILGAWDEEMLFLEEL